MRLRVRLADEGPWFERFEQQDVDVSRRPGRLRICVSREGFDSNRLLFEELAQVVVTAHAIDG